MPALQGANLGIFYGWNLGESNWHTNMDNNLVRLDTVAQLAVKDRNLSAPPGSPTAGDRYIVGPSATGNWATHENEIAVYIGSGWVFYQPRNGWQCYVEDENIPIYYSGGAWSTASIAETGVVHITGTETITGAKTFSAATTFNSVTINGNLTINGTTTTVESATLVIDDPNITLGKDNTTDSQANGGGITLKGASDKTITWSNSSGAWTFSHAIQAPGVNNTGNTTLGSLSTNSVLMNASSMSVPNNLSIQSDTLYIDAANSRVGVGTSTPYATFTVVSQGTNNARGIALEHYDDTTAFSQSKFIGSRARGNRGNPAAVQANDSLASFNGRGRKATAWSNTVGGFYVYAAENWSDSATGTYMTLRGCTPGGTSVGEWARFSHTTATLPSVTTADVVSASNLTLTATGANYIDLVANGSSRARVLPSGRMLLGTTSDDGVNMLQVNGTALFTGAITASGGVAGNASTATKLETARTITTSGDATWSTTFDGSANVTGTLTLANTSVTPGTWTKVTVDSKGRVTSGANLSTGDIPDLSATYAPNPAYGDFGSFTFTTSTTAANQVADSLTASIHRTVKYVMQIVSGSSYHSSEVLIMHDGTTAYITEYAKLLSGTSLATFDADVSAGSLRLLVSPTNAATTFTAVRVAVTA